MSEYQGVYQTVIGVEVHIELATKTKIFCSCSTAFGAPPNTQVCPTCLGMPGTLPILNCQAVHLATMVGMALNCEIAKVSRFDRKNYFYPDNPQNYQISQWYAPLCVNGWIYLPRADKRVGIFNIHLEEDAGKLIHDEEKDLTYVDHNRAGVPLIEIVSKPEMEDAQEVIEFLETLKDFVGYLEASDCKLQEGSMRVDVNLSVRRKGEKKLGTRTEMKNLNSFHAIIRAIEAEEARQIAILEAGGSVSQETRRWDEGKGESYLMRSKEDAMDYRYFPDPDLPPVVLDEGWMEFHQRRLPEFRREKKKRYQKEFGLSEYDAGIMTQSIHLARLFEKTVALGSPAKKVSNWLMGEGLRILREREMDPDELAITPEHFRTPLRLNEEKKLSNAVAKMLFEEAALHDLDPEKAAMERGLFTVCDEDALKTVVEEVLAGNPKSVEDYLGGKEKVLGFLVGQTMKAMKGQADPATVTALLKEFLDPNSP
ncbi:MAG: Asp-tRNA(Asn)/Glu-tRNA(Gln) amidotransferase subunit GatB [Lachnospiraceae bacterium]|nr:Asp-tRNA(Asn)/Glu-tRNA(Gln) amidotransferase subunit GatB [Lachnospiraceae bacterium]